MNYHLFTHKNVVHPFDRGSDRSKKIGYLRSFHRLKCGPSSCGSSLQALPDQDGLDIPRGPPRFVKFPDGIFQPLYLGPVFVVHMSICNSFLEFPYRPFLLGRPLQPNLWISGLCRNPVVGYGQLMIPLGLREGPGRGGKASDIVGGYSGFASQFGCRASFVFAQDVSRVRGYFPTGFLFILLE